MKIAILGTGNVAQSLAKGFLSEKHTVKIGSRTYGPKLAEALKKLADGGFSAEGDTFSEVAKWADTIVVATLGPEIVSTKNGAGPQNLAGAKDVGSMALSVALEAMCITWLGFGAASNTWNHAFKRLTK